MNQLQWIKAIVSFSSVTQAFWRFGYGAIELEIYLV